MKKLLLSFLFAFSLVFAFAAFSPVSSEKDKTDQNKTISSVNLKNLTKDQQHYLMEQFTKMSVKDYEVTSGHKLNFFEKLSFKATQNRMKRQLKREESGSLFSNFDIGGFLLGLLLGLIGVLLAYIFSRDSNFHKWSWIGLGVAVILTLLFII